MTLLFRCWTGDSGDFYGIFDDVEQGISIKHPCGKLEVCPDLTYAKDRCCTLVDEDRAKHRHGDNWQIKRLPVHLQERERLRLKEAQRIAEETD